MSAASGTTFRTTNSALWSRASEAANWKARFDNSAQSIGTRIRFMASTALFSKGRDSLLRARINEPCHIFRLCFELLPRSAGG